MAFIRMVSKNRMGEKRKIIRRPHKGLISRAESARFIPETWLQYRFQKTAKEASVSRAGHATLLRGSEAWERKEE